MLEPIPFAGFVEKPDELTDKEIVDIFQSSYCKCGLDDWEFNHLYFAREILKKASEK